MIKKIENSIPFKGLDVILKVVLVVCSVILTCIIGVCVVMRYILNKDFVGNDELITFFAMWLYWMGAAYGSLEDSHITADMTSIFIKSAKIRRTIAIAVKTLVLVVTAVMAYWGYLYFMLNLKTGGHTMTLKIPNTIICGSISAGLLLMFVYSLYRFFKIFTTTVEDFEIHEEVEE